MFFYFILNGLSVEGLSANSCLVTEFDVFRANITHKSEVLRTYLLSSFKHISYQGKVWIQ